MSTASPAVPLPRRAPAVGAGVGPKVLRTLAVAARWALLNQQQALRLPWLAAAVAALALAIGH